MITPSQLNVLRDAANSDSENGSMSLPPQTVIALCDEVEKAQVDSKRLSWLLTYFVGPRTDLDDAICEAADNGVAQIEKFIDSQIALGA